MDTGVHRHAAALGGGLDGVLDDSRQANGDVLHARAAPLGEPPHGLHVVLRRRIDHGVRAHLVRLGAPGGVRLRDDDQRAAVVQRGQVQQAHDARADDHRGVAAPRHEALDIVEHARQRLGQRRFERVDSFRVAVDLVAVDQRVLAKSGRARRSARLPRHVLVVAQVVVAAAASPTLAAPPQACHRDLVTRRQGLADAWADGHDVARELVAAEERVRPVIDARVHPLLPRAQRRRGDLQQHLARPRFWERHLLELDLAWSGDHRPSIGRWLAHA